MILIVPKKSEELLHVVDGAELVEIKSRKINYGSTSHGLSIRIARGVTYRFAARRHAGVGGNPNCPRPRHFCYHQPEGRVLWHQDNMT